VRILADDPLQLSLILCDRPQNSAKYGADLLLWGQVETNSGIISASVPFLRMLFVSKKKEERGFSERKCVDAGPPKPMGVDVYTQNQALEKPLDFDTWAVAESEKKDPAWKPFITVPESLSSGSRGSTLIGDEKRHPLGTV
jgi:hypothetical protein